VSATLQEIVAHIAGDLGFDGAMNPDRRLRRIAAARGRPIVDFAS
jgi:phosphoserine phosphatase